MLGFGLTVAAIGLGTVFSELVLLIFVIYAISAVTKAISGKKSEAGVSPAQQQAAQPAAVQVQEANDENDIVAAIAAAVASLNLGSVRITAIRRICGSSAPTWSHAGRLDTMNSRQY
jgi:sodium pump decarboxylase gamma subunit